MKKILTLLFLMSLSFSAFSQRLNENEKHLSAILDTLDNEYYWQQIPSDFWGSVPPNAVEYWKEYPFRVKLYELLDDIKVTLAKPMSAEYLLTLYDTKHSRKIGEHYKTIAEKLISFHSDSTNLKLWNIAIAKFETDRQYLYDHFREYIIDEFVRNEILKNETRANILLNRNFKTHYFGYFDKEIDLKVIDAQILYLQTEMKKQSLGDASRWAGYLFMKNGLLPRYDAPVNFRNWYQAKYYNKNAKKNQRSYPDWDNDDDKKNVKLTIRFLKAIKENYDEINEEYKINKE